MDLDTLKLIRPVIQYLRSAGFRRDNSEYDFDDHSNCFHWDNWKTPTLRDGFSIYIDEAEGSLLSLVRNNSGCGIDVNSVEETINVLGAVGLIPVWLTPLYQTGWDHGYAMRGVLRVGS